MSNHDVSNILKKHIAIHIHLYDYAHKNHVMKDKYSEEAQ